MATRETRALDRAVTVAIALLALISGAELIHAIERRDVAAQSLATLLLVLALAPLVSETRAWLHGRRHSP